MGVTLCLPLNLPEEKEQHTARILEMVKAFLKKAILDKKDSLEISAYYSHDGLKLRYLLTLKTPVLGEGNEWLESVEVIMNGKGFWEIRPISYNPPKYPVSGFASDQNGQKNLNSDAQWDLRVDWDYQMNLLLKALTHPYSYQAEVYGLEANENRSAAQRLRTRTKQMKSKISISALSA